MQHPHTMSHVQGAAAAALEVAIKEVQQEKYKGLTFAIVGDVGAGKSSAVNTIASFLSGQLCTLAGVGGTASSFTKDWTTYFIPRAAADSSSDKPPLCGWDLVDSPGDNSRVR